LEECFVLHLNTFNDLIMNELPWGSIYTSTSSMECGDLLDPMIIISLLEPPKWNVEIYLILRLLFHF